MYSVVAGHPIISYGCTPYEYLMLSTYGTKGELTAVKLSHDSTVQFLCTVVLLRTTIVVTSFWNQII
jgi:hypothetical protein